MIVDNRITAVKAGLPFTTDHARSALPRRRRLTNVVLAMIAADKAGIHLDFDRACAIDLAVKGTSKTVLEAVRTSINPQVIDCPNPASGSTKIAPWRATASPWTSAPASPSAPTSTASSAAPPKRRSSPASAKGSSPRSARAAILQGCAGKPRLDFQGGARTRVSTPRPPSRSSRSTSPTSTSADNVGARLQTEQAEADKQVAQAKAEVRRAAAVALEQEMAARTQEMRAKVVEAEAQVPMAIAEAFRSGNLGVMDFVRYKNLLADTDMRESIAGKPGPDTQRP